ncbi:hypothetical protein C8N30_3256 [Sulfitobacter guttiformis]|uniref:Uncharacterized protein n=1 Tax=Sulfitobacter guttiformis TaxID=74349 RepID=A0A420DIV5_9RHOB|nr:hypothetical protein C8N30_3256 [Sulfitobacter guttiformis]
MVSTGPVPFVTARFEDLTFIKCSGVQNPQENACAIL